MQYFMFKYPIFFFALCSLVIHSGNALTRRFYKAIAQHILCGIFLLVLTSITLPKGQVGRSCLEQEIQIKIGEEDELKYGGSFQKVRPAFLCDMTTYFLGLLKKFFSKLSLFESKSKLF